MWEKQQELPCTVERTTQPENLLSNIYNTCRKVKHSLSVHALSNPTENILLFTEKQITTGGKKRALGGRVEGMFVTHAAQHTRPLHSSPRDGFLHFLKSESRPATLILQHTSRFPI